jgi:hypothetical protein
LRPADAGYMEVRIERGVWHVAWRKLQGVIDVINQPLGGLNAKNGLFWLTYAFFGSLIRCYKYKGEKNECLLTRVFECETTGGMPPG